RRFPPSPATCVRCEAGARGRTPTALRRSRGTGACYADQLGGGLCAPSEPPPRQIAPAKPALGAAHQPLVADLEGLARVTPINSEGGCAPLPNLPPGRLHRRSRRSERRTNGSSPISRDWRVLRRWTPRLPGPARNGYSEQASPKSAKAARRRHREL